MAVALPTLRVVQGPDKGRVYDASAESTVIGRNSDQVNLTDNVASRRHAEIKFNGESWILTDLNSANGTYLNGNRIDGSMPLKPGDGIKLGDTVLVFDGDEAGQPPAGAEAPSAHTDRHEHRAAGESSILASVGVSEDGVILPAPDSADAVTAWHVIYKIAQTVGTTDSEHGFLERITDILFEHVSVDRLLLSMRDARAGKLQPEVVRYRKRNGPPGQAGVASQTIVNHVMRTGEGVLCANAMSDDRFTGEGKEDSIHRLGLRSIICVPILVSKQVDGVLYLDCSMSRHTYTQEQLRLVVAIGRLAGMAIQNARLVSSRVNTERLAAAGETVAYLSHHIRNILQGMQGGAAVLEMGLDKGDVDTMKSGWAAVRRNLDRIYHLTMNMLTFSKDREPRITTAELNPIIKDVISLARGRAAEKEVSVSEDLGEIPALPLDPDGMHQVIHNVLINAIEACPARDGRVVVRTRLSDDANCVVLSISDNGQGIPPKARDKLFKAFHSSKGQGGTGLGLAAAKKIVSELHGEIWLETAPAAGTTIHVKLAVERTRSHADNRQPSDSASDQAHVN